jgi:diaminohydroxyphosphoribosylaminopyrimidine deaminase/5-amino-6-(5-phosphoribosylamino)uracil reductase
MSAACRSSRSRPGPRSTDGSARPRGASRWVTGPLARRFAHRLRWASDAILVGAGTIRADDPRLTVRLAGTVAPRLRVVLSSRLDLDPRAAVFDPVPGAPRTRVYTGATAQASTALREVADVIPVEASPGGLDLTAVLRDLATLGVQSVLVEGGGRTHAGFVDAGLAHRVALFLAPTLLGARGTTPLIDRAAAASPQDGVRIVARRIVPLGPELLVLGRLG